MERSLSVSIHEAAPSHTGGRRQSQCRWGYGMACLHSTNGKNHTNNEQKLESTAFNPSEDAGSIAICKYARERNIPSIRKSLITRDQLTLYLAGCHTVHTRFRRDFVLTYFLPTKRIHVGAARGHCLKPSVLKHRAGILYSDPSLIMATGCFRAEA